MRGQLEITDNKFLEILNNENDWYGVFDKLCSMYLDVDGKKTFNSDVTKKEIASCYRRLAHIIHPDKNNEAVDGSYFTFLGNAYDVLSDDSRRGEYDKSARDNRLNAKKAIKDANTAQKKAVSAAVRKQMAEGVMQAELRKRVIEHHREEQQKAKQAQAQALREEYIERLKTAQEQARAEAKARAKAKAKVTAERKARHNNRVAKEKLKHQKDQAGELQGSFEKLIDRIRNLVEVPQDLHDQAERIRSNLDACLRFDMEFSASNVISMINVLEASISKQEKAIDEAERISIEESIIESYQALKIRLNEAYQKLKGISSKSYISEKNQKDLSVLFPQFREIASRIKKAIKNLNNSTHSCILKSIEQVENEINVISQEIDDELGTKSVLTLPCKVPDELNAEFIRENINLQFKGVMNADSHIRRIAIGKLLSIQHECDSNESYQSQVSAAIESCVRPLSDKTELGEFLLKIINSERDTKSGKVHYSFNKKLLEKEHEKINSEEHLPRDVASSAPAVVSQLRKSTPKDKESRMREVRTPDPAASANSGKPNDPPNSKRPSLLVSPPVKQSVTLVASPIRGRRPIGEQSVIRALPPFPSLKLEPNYNPSGVGIFLASNPDNEKLMTRSNQTYDRVKEDLSKLKCLINQINSQRLKKPHKKLNEIEEYDYHNASVLLPPKEVFSIVCEFEMKVVEITRDVQKVYFRLKKKEDDARIAVANAAKVALFSAYAAKNAYTVSQCAVKYAGVTAARKVHLFSQYGSINTELVELIAKLSDDAKIYKSKSKGESKKITERVSSIRKCIFHMNEIAKEYISCSESLIRDQNEKELSQFYRMFLQTLEVSFTNATEADVAERIDLLNTYLSLMYGLLGTTVGEKVKQSDSNMPIAKFRRTSIHALEELKVGCINAAAEYRKFSLAEVLACKEDGESYDELELKKKYLDFVLNKLKITTSKNRSRSLITDQEVDKLFIREIATSDWQRLEEQCSDEIPLEASLKKKIFSTRSEKAINLYLMLGKLKKLVVEHLRRQLTYASSRVFGGMEQSSEDHEDHEELSRDLQLKNNTLLVFEQYQFFTNRNNELILCEQHSVKAKVEIVDSEISIEDFIAYAASLCSGFVSQAMSDHRIINKRYDASLSKVHQCLVIYEQFRNTFNNSSELIEGCGDDLNKVSFIANRKIAIIIDLISAGLSYMEALIGENKHYNPDGKGIKIDDVKQQYSLLKKSYNSCKADEDGWVVNTTDNSVLGVEDFSHKIQRSFTEFTGTVQQFVDEISAAANVEFTAGGGAGFFPRSSVADGSVAGGCTNHSATSYQK